MAENEIHGEEQSREVITRLHIPDSMFVDETRIDNTPKKAQKKLSPLQLVLLLAPALLILGALLAMQAYPNVYRMTYTLFGGVPKPSGFDMDMIYAAFGVLSGNLILCIAGILTSLHVKKRFRGGALFLSIIGAASVGAMLLLIQLW